MKRKNSYIANIVDRTYINVISKIAGKYFPRLQIGLLKKINTSLRMLFI